MSTQRNQIAKSSRKAQFHKTMFLLLRSGVVNHFLSKAAPWEKFNVKFLQKLLGLLPSRSDVLEVRIARSPDPPPADIIWS